MALLDLLGALDRGRFRPILWCNAPALADAARAVGDMAHCSAMRFGADPPVPVLAAPDVRAALRFQRATAEALVRHDRVRLLHANSAAPAQWLVPVARRLRLPGARLELAASFGLSREDLPP